MVNQFIRIALVALNLPPFLEAVAVGLILVGVVALWTWPVGCLVAGGLLLLKAAEQEARGG